MRRAVAVVLGTITGTALLIGAKMGNASQGATTADGNAAAVVVSGGGADVGPASGNPSMPSRTPTANTTPVGPTTASKPTTPARAGTSTPTTSNPTPAKPSGPKDGSYHGSAPVNSGRYGTLSMSVTISAGRIADISASESGGETNCYHNACNTLKPEALQAQSANVSSVSGATYSSSAFKTTLQAILNSAKA
jgi:uncharacterized protein with FMN-binding domain